MTPEVFQWILVIEVGILALVGLVQLLRSR